MRPARIGAGVDHVGERRVDADLVAAQVAPQRTGDAQPVERDHGPRVGRPPAERPVRPERHGEHAAAVGGQQRAGLEVGAHPDEAVSVCVVDGRERPAQRRRLDRHPP